VSAQSPGRLFLAGNHEGRDSRFVWDHGPGGCRCGLHRRAGRRWSQTSRKLHIGDVHTAVCGDVSALSCVDCRRDPCHGVRVRCSLLELSSLRRRERTDVEAPGPTPARCLRRTTYDREIRLRSGGQRARREANVHRCRPPFPDHVAAAGASLNDSRVRKLPSLLTLRDHRERVQTLLCAGFDH
jgi:hypothetical protein